MLRKLIPILAAALVLFGGMARGADDSSRVDSSSTQAAAPASRPSPSADPVLQFTEYPTVVGLGEGRYEIPRGQPEPIEDEAMTPLALTVMSVAVGLLIALLFWAVGRRLRRNR